MDQDQVLISRQPRDQAIALAGHVGIDHRISGLKRSKEGLKKQLGSEWVYILHDMRQGEAKAVSMWQAQVRLVN